MNVKIILLTTSVLVVSLFGCKKKYSSNGETIFRTGKNLLGTTLQDLDKSDKKMAHSCVSCHGSNGSGKGMMSGTGSIKYSDLINPKLHNVPYTDKLLIRFIDHELKSDSTIANTGVVWRMSTQDKIDLINYLKEL
ncbi:MAG: c-type cytochrome [Bacteroidia bacterium]